MEKTYYIVVATRCVILAVGGGILELRALQSCNPDGAPTLLTHRLVTLLLLAARNRLPELLSHGHSRDGVTLHNRPH